MIKKLLITLSFIGLVLCLDAQVIVDGIDINKVDRIKYCQLVGRLKGLSNKIIVNVDYGQARTFLGKQQSITGRDGKKQAFNSMIDALNFMEENGWSFVQLESITIETNTTFYYLLKRKE